MVDLNYRLTLEDFKEFLQTHARRRRPAWVRRVFWLVLIAVVIFLAISDLTQPPGERSYAMVLLLGLLLVFLPFMKFWLTPRVQKKRFDELRMGDGDISFSASKKGVRSAQIDSETTMDWTRFETVTQSGSQIILWMGRNQGLIIPHRAFESVKAADDFLIFAREHISKPDAN